MYTSKTILPIELISFSATQHNNKIDLVWLTESEINNSHFEIQKSYDGIDWKIVGTVSGKGNSSLPILYEYSDSYISLHNYYRLKQVDYDGNFEYSEIIFVNVTEPMIKPYLIKVVNVLDQEIDEEYIGIKIYIYSDGTYTKRINIER